MLNRKPWRRREIRRRLLQPMVKCRRMKRPQFVSKNWIYSWQWKSSRIREHFYRWESFAMNTEILTSGLMVKKTHLIEDGIRIQCNTENFDPIVVPGLSTSSSSSLPSWTTMTPSRKKIEHPTSSSSSSTSPPMTSSTVSSESVARQERGVPCGIDHCPAAVSSKHVEKQERRDPCSSEISEEQPMTKPTKNPKPNKNVDHDQELGDPCHSDITEWLQEFREILVDDEIPEHGDSHASSSHEVPLEPTLKSREDLCKHIVYTHFPKDRNCEIYQRTKITRAPCRRRNGGVVPRAENLGDLITANHKVLSEGCESRNNHRYAVVVQDLATQWIQAYPCKNKTSQETQGACKSSWSRIRSLKSFTLTIPWNLAKLVKIFPGIIVRRHHTDQKQMGLLKEECAV